MVSEFQMCTKNPHPDVEQPQSICSIQYFCYIIPCQKLVERTQPYPHFCGCIPLLSTNNLLNHIPKRLLCQLDHHCFAESVTIAGQLSSVTFIMSLTGARHLVYKRSCLDGGTFRTEIQLGYKRYYGISHAPSQPCWHLPHLATTSVQTYTPVKCHKRHNREQVTPVLSRNCS